MTISPSGIEQPGPAVEASGVQASSRPVDLVMSAEARLELARTRARIAYGLGFVGVALVVTVFAVALYSLSSEAAPKDIAGVYAMLIRVGGHVAVSIAVVYFAYQLLRAAERLLIPMTMVRPEYVEAIRALLGMESPADVLARALKALEPLLKAVAGGKKDD